MTASAPFRDARDAFDVLIAGAGPTGLVLALWLQRKGVRVRIIDAASQPGTTSRALVVHARTLELYRQLGLADDVVARGLPFTGVNLWAHGRPAAHVDLGALGRGLTPYPEMIIFPQDQHERLLIEHLARAGLHVERATKLVGFEVHGDRVHARLQKASGGPDLLCEASYLAGCDGAHSTVRATLGIGFPGGTYERMFYVADVQLRGPASTRELHLGLDDADFLGVFPLAGEGTARLIGTLRGGEAERQALTWDDVSQHAIQSMRLEIERVNWFSTYRVHHRVAERFRGGRAFLVGDAAHIHSPVGGQGMNTGIGDAVNLAWKLAAVTSGRARDHLLDSYEPERIAFARRLVATTDRGFTFVTRDGWLARRMRTGLVPPLMQRLARARGFRRLMFRTVSQTAISYESGPLAQGGGRAGKVRAGQRLPWVAAADNFAPLASLDWQVHVHGDQPAPELAAVMKRRDVPVHVFPWTPEAAAAGLARDAAYLVRPDGYVGIADAQARPAALDEYLTGVNAG